MLNLFKQKRHHFIVAFTTTDCMNHNEALALAAEKNLRLPTRAESLVIAEAAGTRPEIPSFWWTEETGNGKCAWLATARGTLNEAPTENLVCVVLVRTARNGERQ